MTKNKSLSEFQTLFNANVDHHVYTKPISKNIKLKYMQWAWVWWYLKNYDPKTTLRFKQFKEYDWNNHSCTGRMVDFNDTANGCYVTAILTVGGQTQEQSLPVMNNKNQAVIHPNMMQINKAKQRCFVKCAAMFGLGLKIYGMEDTVTYANHRNNSHRHYSGRSGSRNYPRNARNSQRRTQNSNNSPSPTQVKIQKLMNTPVTNSQIKSMHSLVMSVDKSKLNTKQLNAYNFADNNDFTKGNCWYAKWAIYYLQNSPKADSNNKSDDSKKKSNIPKKKDVKNSKKTTLLK